MESSGSNEDPESGPQYRSMNVRIASSDAWPAMDLDERASKSEGRVSNSCPD